MKGLYNKYNVQKNDKDTDPNADYFTLRLDTDEYARQAMLLYAQLIPNSVLAKDIRKKIGNYNEDCSLHLPIAYDSMQEKFIVISEIQYDTYGNLVRVIGINEDGDLEEHHRQNIDLNDTDWY